MEAQLACSRGHNKGLAVQQAVLGGWPAAPAALTTQPAELTAQPAALTAQPAAPAADTYIKNDVLNIQQSIVHREWQQHSAAQQA